MTCIIDQIQNAAKDICWATKDTKAVGFICQDDVGVARDITGSTFRLTVNTEANPDPGTQLFTIVGVIISAPAGTVGFAPLSTDTDVALGTYYYDVEETDAGGAVDTLIKGKCLILKGISP